MKARGVTSTSGAAGRSAILAAAVPIALAVGVFGVIYGAAARPVVGAGAAVVASVLIFSGAAQFTMIGLASVDAGTVAILGAVGLIALRHLALGAMLRPRLDVGRARRAALAWFLLDETAGLAVTLPGRPERTLLLAGSLVYVAWVCGTVLGVTGAAIGSVTPLAEAAFPILFVGLAAINAGAAAARVRAAVAGVATVSMLEAWPAAGALGAIVVALVVAAVGDRS